MAELSKKMNFKNASGVTTQAKLYSTTSEAGAEYQALKVDGITAYVSVGSTSDANATSGRFKKSGTTKAYLKQGGIPYTEMKWTTPGTYTWTCPSGVTKVRASVIAGGGYPLEWMTNVTLTKATKSSFSTLQATTATAFDVAGTPNGKKKTFTLKVNPQSKVTFDGCDGFALDFSVSSVGNYGGSGDLTVIMGKGLNFDQEFSLVSGGKNVGYINVNAGQTYTVVVGRGAETPIGNVSTNDFYVFTMGNTGQNGAVLVAYGGDIK